MNLMKNYFGKEYIETIYILEVVMFFNVVLEYKYNIEKSNFHNSLFCNLACYSIQCATVQFNRITIVLRILTYTNIFNCMAVGRTITADKLIKLRTHTGIYTENLFKYVVYMGGYQTHLKPEASSLYLSRKFIYNTNVRPPFRVNDSGYYQSKIKAVHIYTQTFHIVADYCWVM